MRTLRYVALFLALSSGTSCLVLAAMLGGASLDRQLSAHHQKGLLPTTTSIPNTLPDAFRATLKVRRVDQRWYGSGVEGSYRGMYGILTAAHVVDAPAEFEAVIEREGQADRVESVMVTALDREKDLAWLTVSWKRGPLVDLTPLAGRPTLGEDIWYMGYGAATQRWVEKSIVARRSWKREGGPWDFTGFLVTGRGFYGNSGGPVFVERGERLVLAGIISQWATEDDSCCGFSPLAAVGPGEIASFLDKVVRDHVMGTN
jgi:S1-C subfamily serine protease